MAYSPLEIALVIWAIVAGIYLLLFLYRSIVGMKEEDTLYLSAGESRLESEQRDVMKRIHRIEPLTRVFGWATLVMTILVAGMWGVSVYQELF